MLSYRRELAEPNEGVIPKVYSDTHHDYGPKGDYQGPKRKYPDSDYPRRFRELSHHKREMVRGSHDLWHLTNDFPPMPPLDFMIAEVERCKAEVRAAGLARQAELRALEAQGYYYQSWHRRLSPEAAVALIHYLFIMLMNQRIACAIIFL